MNEISPTRVGQALANQATGTYKASGDIIDYTLYDRFELDATLNHRLFQNGVGTLTPPRTLADTNVRGALGIPLGQKLDIAAIGIWYQSKTVKTSATFQQVLELLQETTLNFGITGKDTYGNWALDEMFGLPMVALIDNGNTNTVEVPSLGHFRGMKPMNEDITLQQQTQFELFIEHHEAVPAEIQGDLIKVGLVGILRRLG